MLLSARLDPRVIDRSSHGEMIKALKAVLLNAENGVNRIVEETADAGAASSPCLRLQIQALPDHSGFPKKIPVKRRAVHFERRLELCKHRG